MARSSAAAARADAAPARSPARRPAPPARRRSGPARESARRAPAPRRARTAAGSQPARVAPALARFVEARTAGLIDRLLRGRLWVGFVGALLAGIVFLNVSLLQLNQDIARTTVKATALDRQNSALRARLAALDSSTRIQNLAEARGMVMPAPIQYRYLRAQPWLDAERAARRRLGSQQLATAPVPLAQPVVSTAPTPSVAAPAASAPPAAASPAPTATAGTP